MCTMIIRSNIPALNAHNKLNQNQSQLGKSLEKLSSGYMINRAADDAAGLAISEKMRSRITGMERAELNSEEGIDLLRTGEGAMQEVHAILNRLKALSVQFANGTYNDGTDRRSMQQELEHICDEVDRIAKATNFNSIHLFQDEGLEAEGVNAASQVTAAQVISSQIAAKGSSTIPEKHEEGLKNIIYTETIFDFETTQAAAGDKNIFTEEYQKVADKLQTSIVPQVVQAITNTYEVFSYLSGTSIGIGLELYSESTSSTLASVKLGTSYITVDGVTTSDTLTYTLSVNVAKVDLNSEAGRSNLEQTIAHEMIHAFMDEATTVGMTGISSSGQSSSNQFPMWFIEGMAQTASGPGNWTRGASLQLTADSTLPDIQAALGGSNALSKSANSTAAGPMTEAISGVIPIRMELRKLSLPLRILLVLPLMPEKMAKVNTSLPDQWTKMATPFTPWMFPILDNFWQTVKSRLTVPEQIRLSAFRLRLLV